MTLDQFMGVLRAEVEAFEVMWREENAKDQENWPMEMDQEDWFEQWTAAAYGRLE
jgi:hypothetical protein